ncbi:beta-galactosidase [Litorihabitans aurantiacus]|uniref:Beta-galactosidase n=1 Tax=Litorihabitans aurantiacus TaxID=1930061 RepID=A0AA38CTL5_9MICO|nr:beta-galactosidase [Litorihabitans aurantiacus]GMA32891.1 beta-galactosidase [Litorihabitans aurantiacus]
MTSNHTERPAPILFGGDYNPEQWPRETWVEDVALMRRARVNTVTLGVFAWSALEPEEGAFTPEWLDEIIGMLDEAGIGFFLSTPTASPPPWFSLAHPDALPVRPDGVRLSHGSRDTYAISAPAYRAAARRIARLLAERYGTHPRLRGWHVHNEYGTLDHGPHAAAAFRRWLRERYADLDALNAAWTTAFWSQRYSSWEEITPPRATQYLANPAHAIDFRRFCSDEMLAAFTEQREEIRAAGSTAPVTTNFMLPTWNHLEQWSWAREQDVVSIDHYLDTTGPDGEAHVAYGSDLTRSWAGGAWLLMEQNAVGIRVGDRTYTKAGDRTIRHSLGYVARGSQSSLFFQWRASAGGSEQWHGALVPHAGGDSRAFATTERLGATLASLAEVTALPADGPLVAADVAIVWDADSWWALETPHLPNDAVRYSDQVRSTHRSFWRAGVPVDFVAPGADLSRYRLVVLACAYTLPADAEAWLRRYVEDGGDVVVTFLSGVADEHLRIVTGGYPGLLRGLLGVASEEVHVLAPEESVRLDDGGLAGDWTEHVRLEGARAVSRMVDGPLAGGPAITRHDVGTGHAYYVSLALDQDSRDAFLAARAADVGARPTLPGASELGVEAVLRRGADADHLFLLHHGDADVVVRGPGTDLLTGATADEADGLRVPAGGAAVLRLAHGDPRGGAHEIARAR